MERRDISPARRRTRNVVAAPIPRAIVRDTIRRVERIPGWIHQAMFVAHIAGGLAMWALVMLHRWGEHGSLTIHVTISAYLLATVAFNSHFPIRMRRWCMAVTDVLLIFMLRIAGELTLVSDPNTTFVVLIAGTSLLFALYLDPKLSRFLAIACSCSGAVVLLPYMLPGLFENLLNVSLSHTWPLQSLLLCVSLVTIVSAPYLAVTHHRRWRLSRATRLLERIQIALATGRNR